MTHSFNQSQVIQAGQDTFVDNAAMGNFFSAIGGSTGDDDVDDDDDDDDDDAIIARWRC